MRLYFSAATAAAAIAIAAAAPAQTAPPVPASGEATFGIFLRGAQIGREQVAVAQTASGWIITSTGRTGAPFDFNITRFEMKYAPDWQPMEMKLEARVKNAPVAIATSFAMTTAINEVTQAGKTVSKEDQISARAIVLPNNVFGSYEALAARLPALAIGAEFPVYIVPQAEVKVTLRGVAEQTLTGPGGEVPTRRFSLTFRNPDATVLDAVVVVDARSRLVRLEIPSAGLLVVREDASSVATRAQTARNPTDTDISIPANGFNLAATLTAPPEVAAKLRHPAVVLVGASTFADRDEVIGGVPVFAHIAKGLADSGHLVVRYDRRGSGQSGGRTETATLADYAEDLRSVVRWVSKRRDVDGARIIVAGRGDGGAVALLAASHDKTIDGVVTLDASGSPGAEVVLQQQQQVLSALNLPAAERQARIDLQKKIQAAVISGTGWQGVPDAMRRQADTPWFKSVLTYDPALVVPKVKQPMLIVQADYDRGIAPEETARLEELARARKKVVPAEVVRAADADRKVASAKVAAAIAEWIRKIG